MSKHRLDTHWGGWNSQRPDHRDREFLPTVGRLDVAQTEFALNVSKIPVLDQMQQGSCTGHGTAGLVMYDQQAQSEKIVVPSRAMIYYNARKAEGTTDQDSGAQVRDAVGGVAKYGVVSDSEFPYNDQVYDKAPSKKVYADATKQEALVYEAVSYPNVNKAIASGFPVVFGFTVYESFESAEVARTGVVPIPRPGEQVLGGHCLAGDTVVPLLSGEEPTIAELAERGGKHWLYSATPDGRIVPGFAEDVRLTKQNAEMVKVVFDDGSDLRCTPEHRVMLRDGSYREAGRLAPGDSIMPLYRRLSEEPTMPGYEQVRHPQNGRWQYTHRLVAAATAGGRYPRGMVVHHDDFDKRNNDPSNLVPMTWEAHTLLHSMQTETLSEYARSNAGRERSRQLMSALWADPAWRAMMEERRPSVTRAGGMASRGVPKTLTSEQRRIIGERGREFLALAQTPEARAKRSETLKQRFAEDEAYRSELLARQRRAAAAAARRPVTDAQREARRRNAEIARSRKAGNNHKVVAIERCSERADVYDLTVPGHHNFAVAGGVFVHNCVWIWGFNSAHTASGNSKIPPRTKACRNSWSKGWGDHGDFFLPQAMFDRGDCSDFWVVRRIGPAGS